MFKQKKTTYIPPKQLLERLEKNLEKLNDLDAKYLLQHPKKMSHAEYTEKRRKLKVKFNTLRKEYEKLRRGV